jgi:hypothetical protein
MKSHDPSSIDWARRVNRTWIVRHQLADHAEAWLDHLALLDDGRLARSCDAARAMCGLRQPLDDPKPWFYAGLFSLATVEEAQTFLANHPITRACLPAMADDEQLGLWISRIGPETRQLLERLRAGLCESGEEI